MKKKIIYCAVIVLAAFLSLGDNCDHGLKPRMTSIEGDVIFVGEWSDEATGCYLGVTNEKPMPLVLDPQLLMGAYQFPVQLVEEKWDSVHFWLEVDAGKYNWIFIVILDDMVFAEPPDYGWRNLAGEYRDPEDSSQLGLVEVGGTEPSYIRIVVDFTVPYVGVGNSPSEYFHLKSEP